MARDSEVVSAGGVSRRSVVVAAAVVISVGGFLAMAASCGGSGSAASGGDAARAEEYAFAGSWTFASAKPVLSCTGQPLEAADLAGHKVTIVASGAHGFVYQDSGCSIPLTVNGSSATNGGVAATCPTGANGLASSIRSVELLAQGPDTISAKIQGEIKGGPAAYDCVSNVTGELRRSLP